MKTYFCSDTHFNHPNILRYEPQRLNAIALYILEYELWDEFLDEITKIKDCVYKGLWFKVIWANALDANEDLRDTLIKIFKILLDSNNYYSEDEEEHKKLKQFQKEHIKVILKYQTEMLINNWNFTVKDDDLVYFLGDFGFGNDKELEEIGRRLKGHKTIIIGNHDGRKYNSDKTIIYNPTLIKHFKACGFERVEFNPIILKGYFILSHEPLYYMNESMPYFNIYGHVHSNPMFKTKTENSLCACLDRWDYKPIEIKEYNEYIPE